MPAQISEIFFRLGKRSPVSFATPYAGHVRRSPHRLPWFRDRLVGGRIRPRDPDAARLAVRAGPSGHGVLPRRMGVPRGGLPGPVRRVAGPGLHRPAAVVPHVRDAHAPADAEMGRPRALALRPAASPAHHRIARTRVDRTPCEGGEPIVGLRTLGGSANRVRRGLARPDALIGSRTNGPFDGFPVALHLDARDPSRRGRHLLVGEHLRDADALVRRAMVRILPPHPGGPHPRGDSAAVRRRLEPGLPGGVRHPGARLRDLHVLSHRGAPRGPRVEPESPDRGGATRRPPGGRRELRRDERPLVSRLCRHRDALRRPGDRRGPRGIRHRRGGLRRAGIRRAPGRADPGPEGVRGTELAAARHMGRRDLRRRSRRERIVELPGAPGAHRPAAVAEGLAGPQATESLVTGATLFEPRPIPRSMERKNVASGARWEPSFGYSRAVRIGNHVAVAGPTATDPEGKVLAPGDAYGQAVHLFRKIAAGSPRPAARLEDVVRTRMFVTSIDDWEKVGRAHTEFFQKIRPAATLVQVSRLIEPQVLVEIEADAILATPG